ncbi:amidase [Methylobacterium persicinum]|uniref:Asp-tRNA(Asn)/Glu-tRNA(Gln) amidotransferase A subunit family amidase n=1 Tax=Methylobacterium persicinum TaxID=374426 RepID=A0ABU0HKN2_9HYPH|nr:amidase [Methylobacterium persicinum]MDQ0442877.1 Asp-tRNA(Asn)/Glu-tRNA(Gln) amidotransferase A subunit family amidase [Methylobacterium persicinum]GJE37375.1 Glutamyl-tRNA(Gln) amidotransferase subunit A [Methylobacterium persicinum]
MLSILDLRARISAGTLTPAGAIDLCREAIDARDGDIGAFVAIDPDPAIPEEGPLAGIAVGVKDIIDTAALPTQMGSVIYEGWRPRADAAVVSRLKERGAVPLAKTTTTAFASSDPTATRNPHDPGHTPGGSSAGSAAAVGAGLLPLALGTQTAGSVIRPASFCGCAAIKPSFRLIPTVGVKTYSWALDTVGLFAAGVGDLAYALAAVTGRDGIDEGAASAPRIAVVRQDFADAAEPAAEAALARACAAAERAGAHVSDRALPPELAAAWERHRLIQDFEAGQALGWEYRHHRDALPPQVRGHLDASGEITPAAYDDARRHAHRARRVLKDLFGEFDAILTYSAPGPAPVSLASTGDARFNRLWTLMGVPCVNVPVPGDRLPVGVQVIGRFGGDGQALAVARLIENALRG